jgi:hypothetical protein
MIAALKGLAQESWVLGIACAAALAYSVLRFAESLVAIGLAIVDGYPPPPEDVFGEAGFDPPYTSVINGHYVSFEPLLHHSILLVLVVASVVVVLRLTGTRDEAPT